MNFGMMVTVIAVGEVVRMSLIWESYNVHKKKQHGITTLHVTNVILPKNFDMTFMGSKCLTLSPMTFCPLISQM